MKFASDRLAIYAAAALCSALLSAYAVYSADIINKDGILYIGVAKAFLSEGLRGAYAAFHWPFFGVLIALLHALTGLGLENAAYLLNALLLMILCTVFVAVYVNTAGSEARPWVAAALILSLPVLNDYRALIVRDFGFWAFMLLALHAFIRYSRTPCIRTALEWQFCILMASLFRIEGFAFLLLAPLYMLFLGEGWRRTLFRILQLNTLFILLLALGAVVLLVVGSGGFGDVSPFGFWLSYASPAAVFGAINAEAGALFERMPHLSSQGEATLILAAGLLALVIVKVAQNAGVLFLAVWGYGWYKKWFRLERDSLIVIYFACIGLLTLTGVAGNRFFLSSRYTVLTVLFLSLISFQYVDRLLREFVRRRHYRWHAFAWTVILVLFLDGVISAGASKENIRLAGEWAKEELPPGTRAACNEPRLAYYSGDACVWFDQADSDAGHYLKQLQLQGYNYTILWIKRGNQALQAAVEDLAVWRPVRKFSNRRGDRVMVYRRLEPERSLQIAD